MRARFQHGAFAIATLVVLAPFVAPQLAAGGPAASLASECEKKAAARPTPECVSCDASVSCLERVTAAGGTAEIIPIANGLMVIYNTGMTKRVAEVQNAAMERWDVTDQIMAGKAEGHLCASCCAARTVLMKADRQVYRTSTGVVAMVTSDDFTLVRELHRMAPRPKPKPTP